MIIFTCEKCKKEFNRKDSYIKHMNRKYSCVIEEKQLKQDNFKEMQKEIINLKESKNETFKKMRDEIQILKKQIELLNIKFSELKT